MADRYIVTLGGLKVQKLGTNAQGEAIVIAHHEIPGGEYFNAKEPLVVDVQQTYAEAVQRLVNSAKAKLESEAQN